MQHVFLSSLKTEQLSHWFSQSYEQAHARFLRGVEALSLTDEIQSWGLSEHPELSTDAIWIGDTQAQNVLVLISGTHGVEGYCGSAGQCFILECLRNASLVLPDNCALLLVHALNPWGMAFARRCDQQGIDINRNFIDFSVLPEPHPAYERVLDAMTLVDRNERRKELMRLQYELGSEEYEKCVSAGQYHVQWAPFYGGNKAAHANKVIAAIIEHWQLESRTLVVLDLHSGLGPWAHGELISDHPVSSEGNKFAHKLFGAAVAVTELGESFSVPKLGLMDYRWHKLMQQQGCFLTLEFGSYGTDALFDVLLDDHLLWKQGGSESEFEKQRKLVIEHFCPQDSFWQQSVLFKVWQSINTVFESFSS